MSEEPAPDHLEGRPATSRFDQGPASPIGIKEGLASLVAMASIFFLMSFWIHFPGMSPNVYSDLMDTLWQRILHAPGIIPYASYNLEYPVVSGAVLYVSSLSKNMYGFYFSISAILFACMLGSVCVVYRTLKERGEPIQRIAYFMVFTPAFVYFSIYSFDWIGSLFMVASLYFGYKRRALWSGASMGLAVASRIIPIVCLPFIFLEFKSKKNRIALLASTGGVWLAANLPLLVSSPKGFLYTYSFQANWGVEDSWVGLAAPYSKEVSVLLLGGAMLLILYKRNKFSLFQQSLLAMLAFVMFSYKFPPQYMIMLLPLFALTGAGYIEFLIANILDVMIILWYFTPVLSGGAPLSALSPVQWIAYERQFALLLVFLRLMLSRAKAIEPVEGEVLVERVPLVQRLRRIASLSHENQ